MRNFIAIASLLSVVLFYNCDSDANFANTQPHVQASCELSDTALWFGGDNRSGQDANGDDYYPRNVMVGQRVILDSTTQITKFSIQLSQAFDFAEAGEDFFKDYNIRLNVREENGAIIDQITRLVANDFPGGWVDFNLDYLDITLTKDVPYVFTWHTVNGEDLAANSFVMGSTAVQADSTKCGFGGFIAETQLINLTNDNRFENYTATTGGINFNYKLEGVVE